MASVLMPAKFQFGTLFGGLIFISGISPISTKKQIWYLEVMVFKRIQNFFWYFLLHERNTVNDLINALSLMNASYLINALLS